MQPALLFNAGSEVLVFGTNPRRNGNAGAIYSRTSGRWRAMPPAPFDPVMQWPSGVWTGRELVVVGLECDPRKSDDEGSCTPGTFVGASYTPKVNQWRKLRIPAEIAAGYHPGDVIGTAHALGWSAERAVFQVNSGTWAFDPERDRWEHLPESAAYSCATKRRLVSLVGTVLSVLEPRAKSWTAAEPVPAGDVAAPFLLTCTDDVVYVHPQVLGAAWRYDPAARRWDALPAPPSPPAFTSGSAWTGRELMVGILIRSPDTFAVSADGFVFDPVAGRWRTTSRVLGLDSASVWTRGYAFTLGYDDSRTVTLQTYRPRSDG